MAKMIHPGLFVGNDSDTYKFAGSILHCAKDPWFTNFLTGIALCRKLGCCRNENEEAKVEANGTVIRVSYKEMALNLVDAAHQMYFPDQTINAGLDFITERFAAGDPVLCHCNMGLSRSPSIAFLWMFEHGFLDDEFRYAVPQFKEIYPDWCPGNGIWNYLKNRCDPPK